MNTNKQKQTLTHFEQITVQNQMSRLLDHLNHCQQTIAAWPAPIRQQHQQQAHILQVLIDHFRKQAITNIKPPMTGDHHDWN